MYRVAICDDEPHAAEQNEAMLCHILEDRNLKRDIDYSIHCFSSPVPLLTQMEKRPSAFHLLLLDIKLENDNGLSLAAHLREIDADCSIIYITAYRDYVFDCAGEPEVVDAVLRHYTAHIKYLSLLVGSQEDEISNFPLVFLILKVLSFLQNHFLGRFHSDCLLWIRIHL